MKFKLKYFLKIERFNIWKVIIKFKLFKNIKINIKKFII